MCFQALASGWFKWKPEYTDRLADDVDLVVVGGYFGLDDDDDDDDDDHYYCYNSKI